jgi:uncharacterized protein DUF4157
MPRSTRNVAHGALVASCLLAAQPMIADPTDPATADDSSIGAALKATASALLASWITTSRDAALEQGVARIPPSIRASLAGYVPDKTLTRVRWRAGGSWDVLTQSAFSFKDAQAVTLDYVVVFASEHDALNDPKLWAHELKHVMQFEEWGVAGFAARYVNDNVAVESEATEYRWEFMKQRGLVPPPSVAPEP